jgi:hypothetical protein
MHDWTLFEWNSKTISYIKLTKITNVSNKPWEVYILLDFFHVRIFRNFYAFYALLLLEFSKKIQSFRFVNFESYQPELIKIQKESKVTCFVAHDETSK